MARRKKKLSELVEELYQEYGYFTYERVDARLSESQKAELMSKAAQGSFKEIEGMRVTGFESLDGYKYFFEGGWLLIRASGTEPIVRLYSEADSEEKVSRALAFAQSLAGLTAEKV
jgi:phosphomannomutase